MPWESLQGLATELNRIVGCSEIRNNELVTKYRGVITRGVHYTIASVTKSWSVIPCKSRARLNSGTPDDIAGGTAE